MTEFMTEEQLAEHLGISLREVHDLARVGAIPSLKLSSTRVFDFDAVARALARLAADGVDLSTHAARQRWKKLNVRVAPSYYEEPDEVPE